eukprot:2426913-Prymnesium_polylepis.1
MLRKREDSQGVEVEELVPSTARPPPASSWRSGCGSSRELRELPSGWVGEFNRSPDTLRGPALTPLRNFGDPSVPPTRPPGSSSDRDTDTADPASAPPADRLPANAAAGARMNGDAAVGALAAAPAVTLGALETAEPFQWASVGHHQTTYKGEDGFCYARVTCGGDVLLLTLVVDGHGGKEAAAYCIEH